LEKVKNSPISEENKKDIFDFHNFFLVLGLGRQKFRGMCLI